MRRPPPAPPHATMTLRYILKDAVVVAVSPLVNITLYFLEEDEEEAFVVRLHRPPPPPVNMTLRYILKEEDPDASRAGSLERGRVQEERLQEGQGHLEGVRLLVAVQ